MCSEVSLAQYAAAWAEDRVRSSRPQPPAALHDALASDAPKHPRSPVQWMVKEPALAVDSRLGAFAMATRTDNEIRELSPEEWDQRVDEQARKRLGMSGEEFERRLNAGEIDIDDSPDVTRVAMMLPLHATHK
jgi:hypothetical protein